MSYTFEDWKLINAYLRELEIAYEGLGTLVRHTEYAKMRDSTLDAGIRSTLADMKQEITVMTAMKSEILRSIGENSGE